MSVSDHAGAACRRALWVSKSDKLIEDAQRDWSALAQERLLVTSLSRFRLGTPTRPDEGILFTTYATLRSDARQERVSRVQQIVDWLGRDFDGVIVFDESHAMQNAARAKIEHGEQASSQQDRAGLRLRHALPDARVLYVSATGATTVHNLAYARRLVMERRLEIPTEKWGDVQVDITPREYVLDNLAHGFPTPLFEPSTDGDGNLFSRGCLVSPAWAHRPSRARHRPSIEPIPSPPCSGGRSCTSRTGLRFAASRSWATSASRPPVSPTVWSTGLRRWGSCPRSSPGGCGCSWRWGTGGPAVLGALMERYALARIAERRAA